VTHMDMGAHDGAPDAAGVGKQMQITAAQSKRFMRNPLSRSNVIKKTSRGRRQHATTRSHCCGVSASGNGVAARALSARARTIRN
jgi:hypothetical protein